VPTGEVRNALAVPARSVSVDETGKPIVRVLDGKTWRPAVVQTGLSDGRYIQIKSGLKEGEIVQVPQSLPHLPIRQL
jgi:multidrug efflux pump subunit AcrA (membrane-fusion protein)